MVRMRPLGERCIMSFGSSAGPPMPRFQHNYQIVQSSDTVTILVEMVHDARVIVLAANIPEYSQNGWAIQ